jgi:hypothetical protein
MDRCEPSQVRAARLGFGRAVHGAMRRGPLSKTWAEALALNRSRDLARYEDTSLQPGRRGRRAAELGAVSRTTHAVLSASAAEPRARTRRILSAVAVEGCRSLLVARSAHWRAPELANRLMGQCSGMSLAPDFGWTDATGCQGGRSVTLVAPPGAGLAMGLCVGETAAGSPRVAAFPGRGEAPVSRGCRRAQPRRPETELERARGHK